MDPLTLATAALVLGAVACFTSVAHLAWVALPDQQPPLASSSSQSWAYNTARD